MTNERHPLDRLAERGRSRGADEVLRAARAVGPTSPARNPRVWIAAAAAVVVIAFGVTAVRDDGGTSTVKTIDQPAVSSTDPAPTTPSTTSAPTTSNTRDVPVPRPAATVFGFSPEDGIVSFVDHGNFDQPDEPDEPDEPVTLTPIGGVRGEEGATSLAVVPSPLAVFHHRFFSGCRSDVVRTEYDGSSVVLVENAVHPAVEATGARLAYASGTECTSDADLLVARDLTTGSTTTVPVGDPSDGLPWRITDVEWVGGRIAVLANQYDGQEAATQWLTLWALDEGRPRFDGQVELGRGDPTTPGAVTNVEPVPGEASSVLLTRRTEEGTGTDLRVLDLATGDETTLFSIDGEMGAFAALNLHDVVYVAVDTEVEGAPGQVDTVRRRIGDREVLLVTGVNSVALPSG